MLRKACGAGVLTWVFGVLVVAAPAAAQFGRGAGAGIGGRGGFGFGRQTTINVSYPYGYGYYGGYSPYVYGGAYVGGWGNGGWGYGGWGYNSGPFGGAGYSLYDVDMLKQQTYALNNSRYNLENAQAVQAYQAANYYQQQATNTYLSNMKMSQELREKYNAETAARIAASRKPPRPFEQFVMADGGVAWPDYAPPNQLRAAADQAIRAAESEKRQDGQASVQSVNEARKKLIAYGRPALRVRREQSKYGNAFRDFLNELDVSLDTLAEPPAQAKAADGDTPPPPPAPKPDK